MTMGKKRSGFKMKGMSFTQGQSPIKNINVKAFKAAPPGSSKEELLEIAQSLVRPVEKPYLDYGGEFYTNINMEGFGGSGSEPWEDAPPPEDTKKKKKKKKFKWNIKMPKWPKKKKKGGVEVDLDYYRKSGQFMKK